MVGNKIEYGSRSMTKKIWILAALLQLAVAAGADSFTDELQWLAKYTACLGQYNMAQTGDYTLGDPTDYYKPSDIREYLARQSGNRTSTATFYGICFDYAQAAYNAITASQGYYESLGMKKDGWYIVAAHENPNQLVLYDLVTRDKTTMILNGVPVRENSRQNVRAHEGAVKHGWLWVYGNDGTIYWIDPTWTDNTGYVWWGVVRNGREEQAAPSSQYCMIKVDPSGAAFGNFNSGNAAKNMSQYDRAMTEYTAALKLDPNNALVYNNRGAAYENKGMYDRAIEDYNQALRLDSNFVNAYSNRGNTYTSKGMYDHAIADCSHALRLNPNFAPAYNNRGLAYWWKKMYDRAIADYTQAIRLDPTIAKFYYNRGVAYYSKGMYDQTIADCNQALRLDSNYADAYQNRGVAYYAKGMYDRAIADYEAVLRLNPNHATTRKDLENARRARRR
jgi:tetratricopeptide (TPR) repeat protein